MVHMAQDGHDAIHVDQAFTIETLVRAAGGAKLTVSKETLDRLDAIRASLVSKMADNERRVYGFNTGFGDNRNRPTVPIALTGVIQDNLILSHASGYGPNLEGEVVRAAMALRAHSLALGYSGIRGRLVDALCGLANSGFLPVVPRFGSVGASGDLAPLSHMSLPLMNKGQVIINGQIGEVGVDLQAPWEVLRYRPSDEFPDIEGPESTFGPKEGLALNNGTAFMAAHLGLAVHKFANLLWHADLALALNTEAMCGVLDAHVSSVQRLRPHRGVNESAERVTRFLRDSKLTVNEGHSTEFVKKQREANGIFDDTQDDYCLRSGPVVHGTAWEAVHNVHQLVETEINSVTDNPLVIDGNVLSGSHFHGMPLAFAADQLRTAMAIVGGVSERRVAKLFNDKRNYGLPRHLVHDDPNGVKSGWMIAQYCSASLVNELKTRSMPYCVGNVTTGNESEDFVSMGANACRSAYECVSVLRGIISIELASAVRALLLRTGCIFDPTNLGDWESQLSSTAQKVIGKFVERKIDVWCAEDRPLDAVFDKTSILIESQNLSSLSA